MIVNQRLVQLVRPGVDIAVDRAIHDVDPAKFHRRLSGVCMLCPNALAELQARMEETFTAEHLEEMKTTLAAMGVMTDDGG